jgi:hypothetical protein
MPIICINQGKTRTRAIWPDGHAASRWQDPQQSSSHPPGRQAAHGSARAPPACLPSRKGGKRAWASPSARSYRVIQCTQVV